MKNHHSVRLVSIARVISLSLGAGLAALFSIESMALEVFRETPGIYRGTEIKTKEDLEWLAILGIKTIISLEGEGSAKKELHKIQEFKGWKDGQQPEFFNVALSAFTVNPGVLPKVNQAINLLAKSKGPIYIHCTHGVDRTGLVLALYKVLHHGVTPKAAMDHMKSQGYHSTWHPNLEAFFWCYPKKNMEKCFHDPYPERFEDDPFNDDKRP